MKSHTIRGVKMHFRFDQELDGEYGTSDPTSVRIHCGYKTPHIDISEGVSGKDLLDTMLHEIAHLCCPYLEEGEITALATNQANVLWRMGYRIGGDNGQDEKSSSNGRLPLRPHDGVNTAEQA